MNRKFTTLLAGAAACALLAQGALADTLSISGTVTARNTHEVYAPIGGTVESVAVMDGQTVEAGDVIASLSTQKVYASESGTITGIFGQPGDSAESVAEKYGAVMYIEGQSVYTIAASTENAYNATANKFVQVGEEVNLSCYSDGTHTGTGVITAIEGTDYTVEVRSGEFLVGETVSVFRGETTSSNRIGRGELTRTSPTAVTGEGSIVSIAVEDGQWVERGDLLFETLSGSFDGLYMSGNQILADTSGVVAQLNVQQGTAVEKGSVAAVLYAPESMMIEAQVSEANLGMIQTGDPVNIELIWNQDAEVTYSGTVSMISAIASEGETGAEGETQEVKYSVWIDFEPDENTRYGMTAIVTTLEDEAQTEVGQDAPAVDQEAQGGE